MQFQLTEATQLLERTPATLTALVGGMPETRQYNGHTYVKQNGQWVLQP